MGTCSQENQDGGTAIGDLSLIMPAMRLESVRTELDKVLERLARLEALSEDDQSWRERTFQRMEQSLTQHGEEIRRFSRDLEVRCSANGSVQHEISKELLFVAQEQF